jgi:PKD repeat protein
MYNKIQHVKDSFIANISHLTSASTLILSIYNIKIFTVMKTHLHLYLQLKSKFIQPQMELIMKFPPGLKKLLFFISVLFLFHNSYAISDFYADRTTILAGDTVQFFDQSTGNVNSYNWTFIGGTPISSSLKNPRIVFLTPGVYNIILVTTYPISPISTTIKTGYITVLDASVGNDNAALVAMIGPKMVDPGVFDVRVKLRNRGENIINNVTINWELNGALQTPIYWVYPLDTINGLTPMDTIITLGSVILSASSGISLRAWTTIPNGMPDPQTSNDTINFTLRTKLSGNYTVGGSNPDFTTINDAVRGLRSDYGIAGPVVFNIRNGVYIENISLDSIRDLTSTKTVMFKSENNDASLVTITYAPTSTQYNYTIQVKSLNYISFKHLTVTSTGITNARAFVIAGTSSFLSVEKCSISTASVTTTNNVITAIFGSTLIGSNFIFKNNVISGGAYAMILSGTNATSPITGLVIDSNTFSGFCNFGYTSSFANNIRFTYNTVKLIAPVTGSSGVSFGNCNGFDVINNKIMGTGIVGLNINNCNGVASDYITIANNEIAIENSVLTSYGLKSASSNYIEYLHNSIRLLSPGTSYAAWFNHTSTSSSNIILRNNIFANAGAAGYAFFVLDPNFMRSDYNLFHSTSASGLILDGSGSTSIVYSSLAGYRLVYPTQEKNSISYRPAFMSNNNLQPNPSDTACWLLNGTGTHTIITTDILGKARSTAALNGAPDLGAYEFTPTVTAPRATPIPSVAVAGQSQAFLYGPDTIAIIEWNSGSAIPSTVEVKNYSDSVIGLYPARLQLRSFTNINMTAPGAYSYNLKYFYRKPLLGNIVNEQDLVGFKRIGNTWTPYSSGTTILDTANNSIKVSALTEHMFDFTGTDNFLPLPVKLVSFDARLLGQDVLLQWSTASEMNNHGFELERSVDGQIFNFAGFVKGTVYSNKTINYNLPDKDAFANSHQTKANSGILYYRLKQVDTDGEYAYSQTIRVNGKTPFLQSVSITPNPYSDVASLSFNSTGDEVSVEILDIRGLVLIKQNHELTNGLNTIHLNESSGLESGIYFIRLSINGEIHLLKLVKN